MKSDPIDDILAGETELVPSSGFLAAVMDRVQEEAAAPPPIPFPWKRAIPGILMAVGVFGWGAIEAVRTIAASHGSLVLPTSLPVAAFSAPVMQSLKVAGLAVGAGAISALSWMLSHRLAGRSGLL